jgi:hypothetical protein
LERCEIFEVSDHSRPQNATASYELLNRVAELCSICR